MALAWVERLTGPAPTEQGVYRVMVSGDSESLEGHTIYEFDDYDTWAFWYIQEDGGYFQGDQDEDDSTIFAYYGPIVIPAYVYPDA